MTGAGLNRRDFLLFRVDQTDAAVLSCEQLYMRYVDARADGTTAALFDRLADDLARVRNVRLIKTSWLSDDELRTRLDALLERVRERGGRVEH